jgi:putative DNA primase/helicase
LREALRPLRMLEAEAAEAHGIAIDAWREATARAQIRRKADAANAFQAAKKGHDFDASQLVAPDEDDEPALRRFVVNDSSVEALGEVLIGNPNGTLLYQDELIGLLRQLDKEGNEGSRAFYLAGWSGSEPYIFDRIGRGLNRRIDAVCLGVLGSIQPAVIGDMLRDAVATNGGDGFLSRFSMLTWPDVSGTWRNIDRLPDSDAYARAVETFRVCEHLEAAQIADAADVGVRFDAEAQAEFDDWREGYEISQRSSDDHPALVAHRDKYRKLIPALALMIHLADSRNRPAIPRIALRQAFAWAEYLDSHARRAYASVIQADLVGARELLRRIRSGDVQSGFRVRDVYVKGWTRLTTSEQTRAAVSVLSEFDYVREIPDSASVRGGRPTTGYAINPKASK